MTGHPLPVDDEPADAGPRPEPFDVCGELPTGMTLLQASAGTGKTFTIAALTTRYVAEGVLPIERLLVITFTRMATGELRERVRERLVRAFDGLTDILGGAGGHADDEIVQLLAAGPRDAVEARRDRLGKAIASFDSATIETTHGFCLQVLYGLGTAGDVDREVTLVEDVSDLLEEVVDDLYLRKFAERPNPLHFTRAQAMEIAKHVFTHPDADIVPPLAADQDLPSIRRRFADAVRKEMERRKQVLKVLTYDDVLMRLRATLLDERRGPAACARLRERYDVVLVDEFQDTDPVQWDIMRRAFGEGGATLVLIGDPKQAIYAFRGADVYAYLDAARVARRRFTLNQNWRSDRPLLEAYDALFDPLRVGHPDIAYRKVDASPGHQSSGLDNAPISAVLRARVVHLADRVGVRLTTRGLAQKAAAVEWVASDLASDVAALLGSEARLVRGPAQVEASAARRVTPGDIAVLVRTNRQVGIVQSALRAAGVPAVVGSSESVFGSVSAFHWLRLLEALEQPASRARAVAVALTPFVGMDAEDVAVADEVVWEDLHGRLHRWAEHLRRVGIAALARAIMADGLPRRVLVDAAGERDLTDLTHLAQLLHAQGSLGQLGPPALRAWLARRIDAYELETTDADGRSRRLDSDAEAVQVLTIHGAKGLEFPIVYCPYLWDAPQLPHQQEPVVYHDETREVPRVLDVGSGPDSPSYRQHAQMAHDEQRGEDLRLLYVALTRARHQAVIWWVRAKDSEHSPLGRLLMFRDGQGHVLASGKFSPKDAEVQRRFEEVAARAPGCVSVERCTRFDPARWDGLTTSTGELSVARFDRRLDVVWRRTSYSAITALDFHREAVGSEPEDSVVTDEPEGPVPADISVRLDAKAGSRAETSPDDQSAAAKTEVRLRGVRSLLADTPTGAEPGTFVHRVLQRVDFQAPDLTGEVSSAVAAGQARRSIRMGDSAQLAAGLAAAISTPLGPLADGKALRDIRWADRVDELGFELPLAGGDRPTGTIPMSAIAHLFERHTEPAGPLSGYASRLRSPALSSLLRGYLTGSLDLVIRLQDQGGEPRFLVIDYKSNWLAPEGEGLTAWHYRPEALDAEMQHAHYPLQAALYSVALHRYLRWRVPNYDPAAHLAGVAYLFLRGMVGPDTPVVDRSPCGVFAWRTPIPLITGLSDLFDEPRPSR
jgi:exodeoxyribonuclease V beta subunit